ncbi:5-(carboxyamino)imidazole ribonucleotide synthase [Thermoactinomyces sp. CICC 10521]|uniref:5-(carboxyamino)imidazole ribonucleotide synthase n=1 Tax=Thermoactinomyces sp. CICC 10521 TaxID=2767426 RepID=UPI0018DBC08C|nr:5-(carboxyamino)imidazole ribonucleotide synthase [Thermoactinomyces sp. CICC 10521]MBH8608128.1 5-(carboxyamino)imidazole ribonucleotide synthase [Thermoactinomyces sp. CICC 10521]
MIETKGQMKVVAPGQTIGILGGGQLGRMTILEGQKMGLQFVTMDPATDCPGGQAAQWHIAAPYDDLHAANRLAEKADLVLYEFENIDPAVVKFLETKTHVPQGSRLLQTAQHRILEKTTLQRAGIPVTDFVPVKSRDDLIRALRQIGLPAVLKTATGGYDGKGQWMLRTKPDLDLLPGDLLDGGRELILEAFIPFVKELSVIVARNPQGDLASFPPAVNLHRNHILHMTVVPAPLAEPVKAQAIAVAERVAETLQVVGLIAVEMFMLKDGRLVVNELAPRPHNSGHYTYDACATSQFEQFVRASLGLPLGPTDLCKPAVMVNILGEHADAFRQAFPSLPGHVKFHWYGKKEAKKGRKMGHVTVLAESVNQALEWIESSSIWPPLTSEEKKVIYDRDYF